MKKTAVGIALFLLSASVLAWTIGPMNYQGRLLDNNGIPLTGAYNFKVRIYDALTGGTLKFSEQQNNVAVDDGVYSFLVSTGTSPTGTWDINLWNTPSLYLEIEVNGQTLTPRHLLAATPFAFQANLALTTNNALALGGKTATEYQNVLGNICESSKGKWLELVQKCLGAGSSFPGPTMVSLATLTASNTLTNLDLTRADIRGIDFGTANLSGTSFDGATLNAQGIKSANLSNTILTNVSTTSSATFTANMSGVKISNTNLTGWNLAGAVLTQSSIAYLTGCPSALPANFVCGNQKMPDDGTRIVYGPAMNFSETSVLKNHFNGTDLSDGNTSWTAKFTGANFDYNRLENIGINDSANASFRGISARMVNWSNVDNANFSDSTILNCGFYGSMVATNFERANLSNVVFRPGNNSSLDFAFAYLLNPIFDQGPTGVSIYFETATLTNPMFASGIASLNFNESTKILGGMYLGSGVTYSYFFETVFSGGNVSGNFRTAYLENQGNGITFYNTTFNGADFTGLVGLGNVGMVGVSWFGAICPDGFHVTTQAGTCVGHFLP